MLNQACLAGRLVKDPELKVTTTGVSVLSFTIAVERDYEEQDGTRGTDFIDCVAWRGTAEYIARNYHKGDLATVCGRIVIRQYEKDGENRKAFEIVVNKCYRTAKRPAVVERDEEGLD